MRFVIQSAALALALALACAACDSGDDDSAKPNAPAKDAGEKADAATPKHGYKPGFGTLKDGGTIFSLGDAGQQMAPDASDAPRSKDGGVGFGDRDRDHDGGASTAGTDAGKPSMPGLEVPADPGARGPWAVGVRTLQVDLGSGRSMPAEVWYPAADKSETDKKPYTYDLADWLPPEAHDMLPADELPIPVPCDCYRDLPIDTEHGPYPVSIVAHAFGGARVEATTLAAHWASRGFIVVAADHPQLTLADGWAVLSGGVCTGDSNVSEDSGRTRDVPAELRALRDAPGDWAFLAGLADLNNFAVSGRIGGAEFAAAMNGTAGMKLLMLWSSSISGKPEGDVRSVVYITGEAPSVYTDSYSTVKTEYGKTAAYNTASTVLVGVKNAASQSFTPYCSAKSAKGLDGEQLDTKYGFCGIVFGNLMSRTDCKAEYLTQAQADTIFEFVTTAALEVALTGKDENAAWSGWKPEWGDRLPKLPGTD